MLTLDITQVLYLVFVNERFSDGGVCPHYTSSSGCWVNNWISSPVSSILEFGCVFKFLFCWHQSGFRQT